MIYFWYRNKGKLIKFFYLWFFLQCLTKLIGMYEFKPSNKLIQMLGKKMCKDGALLQPMCQNIVFLFSGIDKELNTVNITYIQYNRYYIKIILILLSQLIKYIIISKISYII